MFDGGDEQWYDVMSDGIKALRSNDEDFQKALQGDRPIEREEERTKFYFTVVPTNWTNKVGCSFIGLAPKLVDKVKYVYEQDDTFFLDLCCPRKWKDGVPESIFGGQKIAPGSAITIKLDMEVGSLSVLVNDEDKGVLFIDPALTRGEWYPTFAMNPGTLIIIVRHQEEDPDLVSTPDWLELHGEIADLFMFTEKSDRELIKKIAEFFKEKPEEVKAKMNLMISAA